MIDSARERIVAALFALAFALSFAVMAHNSVLDSRSLLFDYHAFACAGAIAGTRDDPYRAEPLRSCEHRQVDFRRDLTNVAVPAPLPGYALAPFAVLGRLPNPLGELLWLGLSLIGALGAGLALTPLSRLPKTTVWAALALPLFWSTIVFGQLLAVALGALCLCALSVERGKYALAGALAWVAMIQPHVALPACIALAIFVPRTRPALGIGAVVAALLSLALLGVGQNIEYFTSVLGAHASSELANEEQYSLAYYLHAMGANDRLALMVADGWYVFAIALGILAAHRLVQRDAPRALYALLPAALAVIGAPFVHIQLAFRRERQFGRWLGPSRMRDLRRLRGGRRVGHRCARGRPGRVRRPNGPSSKSQPNGMRARWGRCAILFAAHRETGRRSASSCRPCGSPSICRSRSPRRTEGAGGRVDPPRARRMCVRGRSASQ